MWSRSASPCAWLPKVPSPDCPFTTIYQIAFPHSAHKVLFAFAGEKSSRSTDHSEKNEWLVASAGKAKRGADYDPTEGTLDLIGRGIWLSKTYLRSTCGERSKGRSRHTLAWRSTFAGRLTETRGWIHQSRRSICAQEEQ